MVAGRGVFFDSKYGIQFWGSFFLGRHPPGLTDPVTFLDFAPGLRDLV